VGSILPHLQDFGLVCKARDKGLKIGWGSNTLPCPHIPYGIHMECKYSMESMWNMFGSIWNIEQSPYGIEIFHGFHVDFIWNGNIPWIPYGMRDLVEFGN